jgi:hypothetical protein
MKTCPYCGYSNHGHATVWRNCDGPFPAAPGAVYQGHAYLYGPTRARHVRSRALSMIVVGLPFKVYWGGYGPWPTIDHRTLVAIRACLEPLLLYGGAAL